MDYNTLQVQEFHTRFQAMITFLESLLARVDAGELVPLDHLDHDVDTLCKEVESAAPEIAREVQPIMAQMIHKLDELVEALNSYKEQLNTAEE